MEIAIITLASVLMIVGIIGSVAPVLPGPPLNYIGLLLLQLLETAPFSTRFLIIFAVLTILVTALDYLIPIYGTKRFGASKYGIWGSTIGLILGIFIFPPFGIIIGPFAGAFIGEMVSGKEVNAALKSGFGSFLGFLTGTFMKFALSVVMTFYFVSALI